MAAHGRPPDRAPSSAHPPAACSSGRALRRRRSGPGAAAAQKTARRVPSTRSAMAQMGRPASGRRRCAGVRPLCRQTSMRAVPKRSGESRFELRREVDLGHQHQGLLAPMKRGTRGMQVDLGLAAAGDAVQQHGGCVACAMACKAAVCSAFRVGAAGPAPRVASAASGGAPPAGAPRAGPGVGCPACAVRAAARPAPVRPRCAGSTRRQSRPGHASPHPAPAGRPARRPTARSSAVAARRGGRSQTTPGTLAPAQRHADQGAGRQRLLTRVVQQCRPPRCGAVFPRPRTAADSCPSPAGVTCAAKARFHLKKAPQVHDRKRLFKLPTQTVDNFVGKLRSSPPSA